MLAQFDALFWMIEGNFLIIIFLLCINITYLKDILSASKDIEKKLK